MNYKYDAFISYRHTIPDAAVAEKLHRLLETYRIPKSIAKATGKKKIQRVFRDRDELPTSSNLADNITSALESSEFLIVICSPRTSQSQWVLKEIETFKKLHGHERILALLIEGEPAESFPEQLRFIKEEKVLEDGAVVEITIEVEPLAADIRADTRRQMFKKLKTEVLRLLAPMLNCRFDDLKQRYRERFIRTVLTVSMSLSAFFIAFGSFASYQAFIIRQKSLEISQKAEEIAQKNIQIQEQINQIQISQSRYLADISNKYYESGDRYRAILAAQAALPKNLKNPDRPYVQEAEYALSRALGVYEVDDFFDGDIVLDHNMPIKFLMTSPDGKTLLASTTDGFIHIWNTEDGSLLSSVFTRNYDNEYNTYFIDDKCFVTLCYNESDGYYCLYSCFDINGSLVWQRKTDSTLITAYNPKKRLIAVYEGYTYDYTERDMVYLIDAATGNELFRTSIKDIIRDSAGENSIFVYLSCITMNKDSSLISFGLNTGKVHTIESTSGKLVNTVSTENKNVENILFSDDGCMIATSYFLPDVEEIEKSNEYLEVFSPQSSTPIFKWKFNDVKKPGFLRTEPSKLIFINQGELNIIDITNGTIEDTFSNNDSILDYYLLNDSAIVISDYAGNIKFLTINNNYNMVELGDFRIVRNQPVKNVVLTNKKLIFSLSSSKKVYLYRQISNEKNVLLNNNINPFSEIFYSPGCNLALSFSTLNNKILIWDVGKNSLIISKSFDEHISKVCFINDDTLLVCFEAEEDVPSRFATMRVNDLAVISEKYFDATRFCINKDSSVMAICEYDGLSLYSLPDMVFLSKIKYEEDPQGIFTTCSFTNDNKFFAVIESQNAMIMDIQARDTLQNYKSNILHYGVISDDGKLCALAFNDKTIKLFDVANTLNERLLINDLRLGVETMFLSPDNSLLFVQLEDYSVYIYDTVNGRLKKTFKNDIIKTILKTIKFSQNNDKIALISYLPTNTYIIDSNTLNILANPTLEDINKDFSYILSRGGYAGNSLYIVPYYSPEMLLAEANRQLNGRVLTEEEKAEMFIN